VNDPCWKEWSETAPLTTFEGKAYVQSTEPMPVPAPRAAEARLWLPPQRFGGVTWEGPEDMPETYARSSHEIRDAWCRVLNFLVAASLVLLFTPLMVLIALAVKLTSRGPVIYVQERVGLDRRSGRGGRIPRNRRRSDRGGKIFRVYKFRTMCYRPAEPQKWAAKGDPRVTRLGRLLRSYRLDELPQLFNVLKGDMNVVGPRPEQPDIFQALRDKVDGYADRQRVLPGITGWAQVNQHYDQCVEDVKRKLEFDLDYISRRSPLEDLKIMTRTPVVMVLRQGSQ
jgi:lipopolysaccharide/colanic/teichoic acid biosynthesis glycosyltransferase